jgi:hypothetical protein
MEGGALKTAKQLSVPRVKAMTDPMDPADTERAYQAWKRVTAMRAEATAAIGMSKADWAKQKIQPKDLKVELGPMLTYEQMMDYCKSTGAGAPHVIHTKK